MLTRRGLFTGAAGAFAALVLARLPLAGKSAEPLRIVAAYLKDGVCTLEFNREPVGASLDWFRCTGVDGTSAARWEARVIDGPRATAHSGMMVWSDPRSLIRQMNCCWEA